MNKHELVKALARETGLSASRSRDYLEKLLRILSLSLQSGASASLPGIGKLHPVDRSPRTGRDPRNGLPIQIKACRAVRFRPSRHLTRSLNELEEYGE
ncbi:HU family DNA-binding protein [Desulfovibrio sp. OttesenSCG-928-G11]|nr:HU family DNA-binding protein [Desulfovibrio sp. OttesenSCG-928-G11]